MYVAELDRSWLHTPFSVHGFIITTSEQMQELQRTCSYVYVDPLLSEGGSDDMFATGLTTRVRALQDTAQTPSPLDRARRDLHILAHQCAHTMRDARRADALALAPLRKAMSPFVAHLVAEPDDMTWLMATELTVPHLHRRALGSAAYMILFGRHLGFDRRVLEDLGLAGALLDIGKISVPVPILAKPGRLTEHERGFVQRHVRRGLYLVRSAAAIPEVMEESLLSHHERLDGSGYPRGLKGTRIPLFGRIAGIVDTYDALIQERRYALAASPHDALRLVNAGRGIRFDAALVRSFVRALGIYPTGSWLQLADGRLGIVRRQVPDEPLRPQVALVSDSAGRALAEGEPLWRPVHPGDIARALTPRDLKINGHVMEQALHTAGNLAA